MDKKVAVLVIHGMNNGENRYDEHYADGMMAEINSRIGDMDLDPEQVAWLPLFWADIIEERQRDYLEAAALQNHLDLMPARHFVTSFLADALAYRKTDNSSLDTYGRINTYISEQIKHLYATELNNQPVPLIVTAHSLGGQIMSSFIWDMQNGLAPDMQSKSDFETMKYLAGLITFGCNIPLFTFALDENAIEPINPVGEMLNPQQQSLVKWKNFYDRDDILAYPLKTIPAYSNVVEADFEINVGNVLQHWNPACHDYYWTDRDFTKPCAQYIAQFL